jgi:hypothetical protein
VVAYIEGEGRLVIESPAAVQRALLAEWSEVAGERSLVDDLLADRRAAAVREAEEVEADLASHGPGSEADAAGHGGGPGVKADAAGHGRGPGVEPGGQRRDAGD